MRFLGTWHNDKTASDSFIKTHCWSCKCEEGLYELWIVIVQVILCLRCPRSAVRTHKSLADSILATCAAAHVPSAVVRIASLHSSVVLSSHNCCCFSSTVTSGGLHQDKEYEERVCSSLFSKSWSHSSSSWLASEKGSRERSCKIQREFSVSPSGATVPVAVPLVCYITLLSQGRRVSLNITS